MGVRMAGVWGRGRHQIKGYLRLAADPGDPMLGEHQAAVHQFLANVFTAIARHADVVTCHFAVVQSGARCIQMFGAWLAKHDALVNGAVGYALKALRLGPTADFAAGALATLCSRCAKKFRNKATVSQLVESLDAGVWLPLAVAAWLCCGCVDVWLWLCGCVAVAVAVAV